MQPASLRPMSVTDIIDATFRLYRNNFGLFLGIVALLQLPIILLQIGGTFALAAPLTDLLLTLEANNPFASQSFALPSGVSIAGIILALVLLVLFLLIQTIVVQNIVTGAVVHAAAERSHDRPVGIGSAYRAALPHLLTLILTSFVIGGASLLLFALPLSLLTLSALSLGMFSDPLQRTGTVFAAIGIVLLFLVALLLIVVLGFIITVLFGFTAQSIVLEQQGIFGALRRSYELVRSAVWRVVGLMLLIGILVWLIQYIPTTVVQAILALFFGVPEQVFIQQSLSSAWGYTMQILTYPFQLIGMTLLYYDIRMRYEGYDLELRTTPRNAPAGEQVQL